jgi:hypothetical protein
VLSLTAPPGEDHEQEFSRVSAARSDQGGLRKRLFQFAPPPSRPRPPGKPYHSEGWQWAVATFLAIDLLVAGWGLNPGAPLDLYAASPVASQVDRLAQGGRLYLPKYQEDWLKYVRFLRFDSFNSGEDWRNLRAVLLPDTTLLDGIASTNNFDPLLPGRYADWLEMLEQATPAAHDQMLRLMGVGVIESLNRKLPFGVQYQPFDGRRLRWIDCALSASSPAQARSLVLEGGLDFDQMVVLEGLTELPVDDCQKSIRANPQANEAMNEAPAIEQAVIQVAGTNPNRLEFRSSSRTPVWLVLSDVWYPGWQGRVDGKPVQLLRANYLFQALRVPAGEHQIVLVYQPLAFWGGAALSLGTWIAAFYIVFRRRRIAHRPRSAEE